jgi:hypothetical protein
LLWNREQIAEGVASVEKALFEFGDQCYHMRVNAIPYSLMRCPLGW